MKLISKTDYLMYRECPKNAWIKLHRPDIFAQFPLTDFEQSVIDIGVSVEEEYARKLFPDATLVEGRDEAAQEKTRELIGTKTPAIFQPVFVADGFLTACDILKYDPATDAWDIYEVKATNATKETGGRNHIDDVAFQRIVLTDAGIRVGKCFIMHLNSEYIRKGELDLDALFVSDDVTDKASELENETREQMTRAKAYLSQEIEPTGYCSCIYKGKSSHCTTFPYSNPSIPAYGIHNLSRIGASKKKLKELADREIWSLDDLPSDIEFSDAQQAQINAYLHGTHIDTRGIRDELAELEFPLYFLDYETFPAAIPRHEGYSPYQHVPFQYSLHKLAAPDAELKHFEFLHTTSGDPALALAETLRENIGDKGTVISWHKSFECSKNTEMAKRMPVYADFFARVNDRMYDLEDVFKKLHYVHKDFKGKTSIKYVLPVVAPGLSYAELVVRNGQMAMEQWDKIARGEVKNEEITDIARDLLEYCKLDTYAMYAIWRELYKLVNK